MIFFGGYNTPPAGNGIKNRAIVRFFLQMFRTY